MLRIHHVEALAVVATMVANRVRPTSTPASRCTAGCGVVSTSTTKLA